MKEPKFIELRVRMAMAFKELAAYEQCGKIENIY